MSRALLPLLTLAVLVGFFWRSLSLDPTILPSPLIDQPAPDFVLPMLSDPHSTTTLSDLHGSVVLVNVWGSWCVGCFEEHAMLMRIAAEGRVPIYGINWKDQTENAHAFLEQRGDPYLVNAVDQSGDVAIDWGVYGAPETFIVDADGVVRFKHIGPITEAVWVQEIKPRVLNLIGEGG